MTLRTATENNSNAHEIVEGLLRYFNHLWRFLEGENPKDADQQKPNWRTETRYKLDEVTLLRRFLATSELVGIRFSIGAKSVTNYLMLDIDRWSRNHPLVNPEAFKRLLEAFEDVGLPDKVLVRSSPSLGLHIYIPMSEDMHVFTAACWLEKIVKSAGFEIEQGHLECFPNAKTRSTGKKFTLYNGHRLPMQPDSGSLLLNDELEPTSDNFLDFIAQMDFVATHRNFVDEEMRAEAELARDAITKERIFKSKNAKSIIEEWKKDLEFYQSVGWTSIGQTNNLLCKFATYGRVYLGLGNQDLKKYIIETARNAPGYWEHCRHKHEIEKRAHDRAKGAMKYYWKLGDVAKRESTYKSISGQLLENITNGNEARAYNAVERMEAALKRIQQLVTGFENNKTKFWEFISTISKEMFGEGIGKGTFYKKENLHIWESVFAALVLAGQVATASVAEAAELIDIVPVPTIQIEEGSEVVEHVEIISETPPEIAETPINPDEFGRCTEEQEPEPLKAAENKDSSDVAIYEGFCKGEAPTSKNLKNLSPVPRPSQPINLANPSQPAQPLQKPRPILKSEHKQRLSLDREQRLTAYYAEAQQRHASIKALDDQLKTPEYKTASAASIAAIRQILDRARAKFRHGDPSTPP